MNHKGLLPAMLFFTAALFCSSCINPFAPDLREGDPFTDLLGDPSTIEGFYTRFQKAYELRDTSLYGPLIHPDFTFTFRDQDRNVDVTWGRPEEMNSTYNMFINSYDVSLRWNNITSQFINEDATEGQVIRRFNLSVAVTPSEIYRTDGSANFRISRQDSSKQWRLVAWRDESDL